MVENTGSGGSARTPRRRASMLARRWCLASQYGDPTEYDIPELPVWAVTRPDGGLAFAGGEAADPFIRAEQPIRVRR